MQWLLPQVSREQRIGLTDKALAAVDCQGTQTGFHPVMPASPTSPGECRAKHLAPIKVHKPVPNWLSEVSQVPAGVGGEAQEQAECLSPLS